MPERCRYCKQNVRYENSGMRVMRKSICSDCLLEVCDRAMNYKEEVETPEIVPKKEELKKESPEKIIHEKYPEKENE